jgi:hypothetical protein
LPVRTSRGRKGGNRARTNTNGRAPSAKSSYLPSRPRYDYVKCLLLSRVKNLSTRRVPHAACSRVALQKRASLLAPVVLGTGFGSQASLFEIAFTGLAFAA